MKLLVIQNKMIGDVLTSTVICEAIKKTQSTWEIHYMIQPNTLAVVENNPFIDKIIFFEPKNHKGFLNVMAFGKSLQFEKYDAVIDVYGKWSSVLTSYFSKAKIRIGFKKGYTSLLFTTTILPKKDIENAAVFHRLQLVEAVMKTNIEPVFPKIYVTDSEIIQVKIRLNNELNLSLKTIMISVLGSSSIKSLPPKQMAETLDLIANESDIQLLFNYLPNQKKEAQLIYDLCQNTTQQKIAFDFQVKNLREFLAVLSQCDAAIGNEGGAINMAKALQIPTFAIFSPWINKKAWSSKNDGENHISIHLMDYYPEIYGNNHPKKLKNQSLELYPKLESILYKNELRKFVNRIIS
jgi:ADP-heptose:LPS heptosyltransferase